MANIPSDRQPLGRLIYSDKCEDVREVLIDLINTKHANRIITLCAYKDETSGKLKKVPNDWALDWVGSNAEPFGYYCDVSASPRPRRAINEKLPSGVVRLFREWFNMRDGARYDPPSTTLGAELYHRSLHCLWRRVHISEAIFNELVLEARGAEPEMPREPQQPQPLPRGRMLDAALYNWIETSFEPDGPAQGGKQHYKLPSRAELYCRMKAKPEFWKGTYDDVKRLRRKYASRESRVGGARFHHPK